MTDDRIPELTRREKRYLLASVHHMPGRLAGDSIVIAQREAGARTPLFFVPVDPPLLKLLDPHTPLYGFPDPMPVAANDAKTYVYSLAKYYIEELRKVQPRGPYRLGGYCFGGLVAYEMAQQISRSGERVELLALVETPAPGPVHDWVAKAKSLSIHVERWASRCRSPRRFYWWARHALGSIVRPQRDGQSRRTAWFPDAPYDDATKQRIKTALMTYTPKPYDGAVTLFFTQTGSMIRSPLAPKGGWGRMPVAGTDVHTVPGTHGTVYQQATFADALNEVLEEMPARTASREHDQVVDTTPQVPMTVTGS